MNHVFGLGGSETTAEKPAARIYPAVTGSSTSPPAYSSLLYARGFYLTKYQAPDLEAHWSSSGFGNYTLAWDNRNPVGIVEHDGYGVAIVGRCYDLSSGVGDPVEVLRSVLRSAQSGTASLDRTLYELAGRYIIIVRTPDELILESDATGMKGAYYATAGGIVASHAELAARLTGDTAPSQFGSHGWLGRNGASTFPGNYTEYRAIRLLTPSLQLSVDIGATRRVYPIGRPPSLTVGEAAENILGDMRMQVDWLTAENQPLVSLTAGMDSRVTLAATRERKQDCLYFSYATAAGGSVKSTNADRTFAASLAGREGLRFRGVQAPPDIDPELLDIMRRNSVRPHARAVAAAYREQLPLDAVHIRSNIYEIGRSYYHHGTPRDSRMMTAERMSQLLIGKREVPQRILEAFQEWIELASFGEQADGYDLYDLYYWEIRMGSWMQAVMLESDIAHDTYTLVNSRRILTSFLGVSKPDRAAGSVSRAIIKSAWPQLFSYPVNGVVYED